MDEEKKTYSSRCLLVHFSFSISSDCCWFLQNRLKGGRGRKREIKREKKEKKKSTIDMLQVNRSTVWLQGRGTY